MPVKTILWRHSEPLREPERWKTMGYDAVQLSSTEFCMPNCPLRQIVEVRKEQAIPDDAIPLFLISAENDLQSLPGLLNHFRGRLWIEAVVTEALPLPAILQIYQMAGENEIFLTFPIAYSTGNGLLGRNGVSTIVSAPADERSQSERGHALLQRNEGADLQGASALPR